MKKKLSAALGTFAACALVFGLSGCIKSTTTEEKETKEPEKTSIADATKPVTMTKAFNSEGIWYYGASPSEAGKIANIIVFNGEGEITVYDVSYPRDSDLRDSDYLTYADLEDLSDDEIISLAKDRDKKVFEVTREENISKIENYADAEEFYDSYNMTPDEALEKLKNFEYQAPKPQSFKLKVVETDFDIVEYYKTDMFYSDFYWDSETFGEYTTDKGSFTFYGINVDVDTEKVGTMYFDGYAIPEKGSGFYTQVSKKFPGFILDKSKDEDDDTDEE